jgi:hypothetical protein
VLHVSQLKKSVPSNQVVSSTLDFNFLADDASPVQPGAVISKRTIRKGRTFVDQVQISWTGLPSTLLTWESEAALRRRFPGAPAWGQAGFEGRGTATTPACKRRRLRDIRRSMGRQVQINPNGPRLVHLRA